MTDAIRKILETTAEYWNLQRKNSDERISDIR